MAAHIQPQYISQSGQTTAEFPIGNKCFLQCRGAPPPLENCAAGQEVGEDLGQEEERCAEEGSCSLKWYLKHDASYFDVSRSLQMYLKPPPMNSFLVGSALNKFEDDRQTYHI